MRTTVLVVFVMAGMVMLAKEAALFPVLKSQELDQINPPLKAPAGRQLWAARESQRMNFRDLDDAPQETLNKVLWLDAKGYDAPYSTAGKH